MAMPYADGSPVVIPAGRHTVYVESADRDYASPTRDVVAGVSTKVDIVLFPQRSINGDVRFGGSPDAESSLEGIRVVLEPSGESATTDADGHFVFARAPYDPASTILLDPASVPPGFDSPGALPIGTGPVTVTLEPRRKTEHTSFH